MRPGDLILVRGRGLFAYLIRQTGGGHWSHIEIVVSPTESVAAMQGAGIRRCNFSEAFKDEEWRGARVLMASDSQAKAVANLAVDMIGGKYDTRAILGVWLRFILKRLDIRLAAGNPTQENKKFFCSELVAYLFAQQGCSFTSNTPALTTPSEIAEAKIVAELPDHGGSHGA